MLTTRSSAPDDTVTCRPPAHSTIRIVPELRAVHLERHPAMTPADNLHFAEKYDLAGTALPPTVTKLSTVTAVRRLATSHATTLELPEPLWMRFLPTWIALAASWKLSGLVRRRPRRIVTYAMELTPFSTLLGGSTSLPGPVVASVGSLVGALIRLTVDRICFASPAASELYSSLPFVTAVEHRTILELPAPRTDPRASTPVASSVAFVGLLAERNGLSLLMEAWEQVEHRRPDAHLTIIGDGPMAADVRRWRAVRPGSRSATGHLGRPEVLAHLRDAAVLAAPSIPEGRWREQIGLPIKEALASGATIVTTRQTGLAEWLSAHGHTVLDVDASLVTRLEDALVAAIDDPLPRDVVLEALPANDGRLASDHWLHSLSRSTAGEERS